MLDSILHCMFQKYINYVPCVQKRTKFPPKHSQKRETDYIFQFLKSLLYYGNSSNYFISNILLGKHTLEFETTVVNRSVGYSANGTITFIQLLKPKIWNHANCLAPYLSVSQTTRPISKFNGLEPLTQATFQCLHHYSQYVIIFLIDHYNILLTGLFPLLLSYSLFFTKQPVPKYWKWKPKSDWGRQIHRVDKKTY